MQLNTITKPNFRRVNFYSLLASVRGEFFSGVVSGLLNV